MDTKAVFFDIDGTLLTDTKRLKPSTVQAIKSLKNQGIYVGLATGRGPAFVAPLMENYGFDFAVTYNGQYVISQSEEIYAKVLPRSVLLNLVQYAKTHRLELSFGTKSGLMGSGLINLGSASKAQVLGNIVPRRLAKTVEGALKNVVRRIRPQNHGRLEALTDEIVYQVVAVAAADKTAELAAAFPSLSVTRSSPYSADLISKGQSKLEGIRRLGQRFGFKLDEVMAFGDSDNDRDMLAHVGIGVAMGNGGASLKALATYTTKSNNDDGIAEALWHYGLIQFDHKHPFQSADQQFNQVRDFHQVMEGQTKNLPQTLTLKEAQQRADVKMEELVELLYACSQGDSSTFSQSLADLHVALDRAAAKVKEAPLTTSPLVAQADALTDLLYLTYGSFVKMGIDPKPLFDIVHKANMGKIFPDGKPRLDPVTGKVLKPDHWQERFAPEPALKRELERQVKKALRQKEGKTD